MTIKKLLLRNTIFIGVLLIVVIVAQILVNIRLNKEYQQKELSEALAHQIEEIILLSNEWQYFSNERIFQQLTLRSQKIEQLLAEHPAHDQKLQNAYERLSHNFRELILSRREENKEQGIGQQAQLTEKQAWLLTETHLAARALLQKVFENNSASSKRIRELHTVNTAAMLGTILLISVIILLFSYNNAQNISSSIKELKAGILHFKEGNYAYRYNLKQKCAITRIEDTSLLASSINSMLGMIEANHQNLTQQNNEYEAVNEELRQTNEELYEAKLETEESEQKFKSLFNNPSVIQWIIDPETHYIVDANKAAVSFYGWPKEELLNMKLEQINTLSEQELAAIMTSITPKRSAPLLFKHIKAHGETAIVEVHTSQVEITGKKYVHSIIHDITEKEENAQQLGLLSKAIQQTNASVMITDKEGTIIYANQAFLNRTGYSSEEIINQKPQILNSGYHPPEFFKDLWGTIRQGEGWRGEILNKKKNGEPYWSDCSITSLKDHAGEITHFVAVQEDITAIKKMQNELVVAKENAEEGDKLKSAFLQNISHEIRTPMNGIIGFAEMLKMPNLEEEKQEYFLDVIVQSSNQLLSIVNNIITISALETKQETLNEKKVDINNLTHNLFALFHEQSKAKGINLSLQNQLAPEEAMVIADETKLHQVLSNLLSNAFKFTHEGEIELGCSRQNNQLQFYVKDTGIGIEEELHNFIFERFRQADLSSTRQYGGNGLGLAIAKEFVELMGGEIHLSSNLGKGSTFYVNLPYKPTQQNRTQTRKLAPVKEATVLIAEDEEYNYLYLSELLLRYNISALHAHNGKEAIDMCEAHPEIDAVLMDIKMPKMDGQEAARILKNKYPHIPVIAQTAYALDSEKETYGKVFDDYVTKPIEEGKLERVLGTHLNKETT